MFFALERIALQEFHIVAEFFPDAADHILHITQSRHVRAERKRNCLFRHIPQKKAVAVRREPAAQAQLLIEAQRIDERDAASLTAQLQQKAV